MAPESYNTSTSEIITQLRRNLKLRDELSKIHLNHESEEKLLRLYRGLQRWPFWYRVVTFAIVVGFRWALSIKKHL